MVRSSNLCSDWQTEAVAQRCSVKKVFLEISQNSQENTCATVSLRSAPLLQKRLWHKRFPVNFAKFLRTPFLKKHLQWLLLKRHQWHRCPWCPWNKTSSEFKNRNKNWPAFRYCRRISSSSQCTSDKLRSTPQSSLYRISVNSIFEDEIVEYFNSRREYEVFIDNLKVL